jgi:glycosyltransferase involved in cell wall biosynthesis
MTNDCLEQVHLLSLAAPRLAILADFKEEEWPSMDLVAEMLFKQASAHHGDKLRPVFVRPRFHYRCGRLPWLGSSRWASRADRLLNRRWDYTRYLRRGVQDFDLFHICDHSYAHLVHALPGERTGVMCHDLDAFRCILEPGSGPGSYWGLARQALSGMQRAAVVFHDSTAVGRQIVKHGLLDPARLVHAPLGVAPEFTSEPLDSEPAHKLEPGLRQAPFLLHVSSCIARKRVDVLLEVFAGVRSRHPGLRLVQVGGQWTEAQRQQIQRLNLAEAVVQLRGLPRTSLAALYQQAALVLMPSEAEGFGIPVVEALACGTPVVASDLEVLREVGGPACIYCTVADIPRWVQTVSGLLDKPQLAPDRATRLAWASRFTWLAHTRTIVETYARLT